MSLNCLACHDLPRSDSDVDLRRRKDPNFSGKITPTVYDKMMRNGSLLPQVRRIKKGHRRLYSADAVVYEGSGEPRLVRSCGIRRDWSFEDLNKQAEQCIEKTVQK